MFTASGQRKFLPEGWNQEMGEGGCFYLIRGQEAGQIQSGEPMAMVAMGLSQFQRFLSYNISTELHTRDLDIGLQDTNTALPTQSWCLQFTF